MSEIEVAVLGPVEVRGAGRFTRAAAAELVVYLAMHPRGAVTEQWATALWPERAMAPPTLHSTASAARSALGRSSTGGLHLPRRHGRLQLAPTVATDWSRLGASARSSDPADWAEGLRLVRGRPFEGLRRADWTVFEGYAAELEEQVVELAVRMAEHHLAAGALTLAGRAARRGLRASPYDERLFRLLLRTADRQGNPAGVERVMGELIQLVVGSPDGTGAGLLDLDGAVHPQTAALYRSLSRRSWGAPERVVARL